MSYKKIILSAAAIFLSSVIIFGSIIWAVVDESQVIQIKEQLKAEEIENSTLIIGTHLIHISALNDSLYDIAIESAESLGQYEIYYKSELADGKWFEISAAAGISDIMEEEKAVDNSVIEGLYVRYHTKSDGITYDLMSGRSVCIFDIINPYKLDTLPELEAVAIYYQSLQGKDKKTETDSRNIKLIEAAIGRDFSDYLNKENEEQKENIDENIAAFQEYYERAAGMDKDTKATSLSIMEGLDSTRRLMVYSVLYYEILPKLLSDVQTNGDDIEGFYEDSGLESAIGTAMEEVEKKLTGCEAEAIEEGDTTISRTKYSMIEQAAELVKSDNTDALDRLMENIADITSIENGAINNPEREAMLIKDTLIPEALNNMLKEESGDGDFSDNMWEIEYLVKTAVPGMSREDSVAFIEAITQRLDEISESEQGEDVRKEAEEIKDKFSKLKNELSSETSKLGELISQKEELKTKRQSSLDVNNLTEAEKIGLEIDDINEEIEKEEQRLTAIISSETASASDKAKARAALETGTASDAIINTKESIQASIADGEYSDGMAGLEAMEAFMGINLPLALSGMQDIYSDVLTKLYLEGDKDSGLKEIKEALEKIISDNSEAIEDSLSEKTALSILEGVSGAAYEDCNYMQKVCMAAALFIYGDETRNDDIKTMAAGLISCLYSEGNPYVYLKLKNEPEQFIPLKTFSDCSTYRYVFYNGSKSVTLAKGTEYHTYTVFKSQAVHNNGTEEMKTYARYQADIYLKDTYMTEKFNVSCIYIDDTDYGVLVTQDIEKECTRLLESLYNAAN